MQANILSDVHATLKEKFEASNGAKNWNEADIQPSTRSDGSSVWWVKDEFIENAIDHSTLYQLAAAGLLENEGKFRQKKWGKTSARAVGVLIHKLSDAAQAANAEAGQLAVVQKEVQSLRRQLKAAHEESAADTAMAELIQKINNGYVPRPPAATKRKPAKRTTGDSLAGIPTLMLSDTHFGEVVAPEQVEGWNEYNHDIAVRRLNRVFEQTMQQLFSHQSDTRYDAFCLIFGGDILSGDIHDELRATNEQGIVECMLTYAPKLADKIVDVADNFPAVYVPAVVGNHGRLDRKPPAKNAVTNNYDYLLYNMVKAEVERRMGDRCNVEFDISMSLDMSFRLYNTTYLLSHGDQIKGGSGVGSFWPSMMRTVFKKQQRMGNACKQNFDYFVCGHFHRYGAVSNIIVNGSLKGYDEYAYKMNFEYEPPIQALWTTHPDYGVISRIPVFADEHVQDTNSLVVPVTPSSGLRR